MSIGPQVCSTLPSDPASRRRPCASLTLAIRLGRGLSPPSCRTCSAHKQKPHFRGAFFLFNCAARSVADPNSRPDPRPSIIIPNGPPCSPVTTRTGVIDGLRFVVGRSRVVRPRRCGGTDDCTGGEATDNSKSNARTVVGIGGSIAAAYRSRGKNYSQAGT